MKKLLCVVVCLLAFVHIANAQTRLEMRLAETEPGVGLTEATIPASGQKIYLHESSIITNADVVDAHVVPGNGTFNIAVRLAVDGAARLENATRGHIGKPLAIVVNGTVISAPTVRGAIGQDGDINGNYTQAQAEKIAAGLTGR